MTATAHQPAATGALPDADTCYRAVSGRDPRFDGWIYVGVTSTGIYCRPSCPALTPRRENCRWFAAAGAAQQAGFRACRRCHPDAVPGSPEWNLRGDVAARAMRLIADGVVDREGVSGLARRLGYSERQLHRMLVAETGASPVALARAQRAHAARLLIENTTLTMADIAFAAGFSSIRQFNDTIGEVFGATPTRLRAARRTPAAGSAGTLRLRLPVREPFDGAALLRFLGTRTVAGTESAQLADGPLRFARSVRLPHGPGVFELVVTPGATSPLEAIVGLAELRDLGPLVARLRRMCDLDADPVAIDGVLGAHPAFAPLVAAHPGLRIPGGPDPDELAVRALLGQQISLLGGVRAAERLVAEHGEDLPPELVRGAVTRLFPSMATLAAANPDAFAMPRSRGRALVGLAATLAAGEIDLGPAADRPAAYRALTALRGIGPWTAGYLMIRALGDPDVLLDSDLIIRRELDRRGVTDTDRLAPWRTYASLHLWNGAPS
ncbi:AlkA N-terminal domain-containing protein [Naumannella huperziae]